MWATSAHYSSSFWQYSTGIVDYLISTILPFPIGHFSMIPSIRMTKCFESLCSLWWLSCCLQKVAHYMSKINFPVFLILPQCCRRFSSSPTWWFTRRKHFLFYSLHSILTGVTSVLRYVPLQCFQSASQLITKSSQNIYIQISCGKKSKYK